MPVRVDESQLIHCLAGHIDVTGYGFKLAHNLENLVASSITETWSVGDGLVHPALLRISGRSENRLPNWMGAKLLHSHPSSTAIRQ